MKDSAISSFGSVPNENLDRSGDMAELKPAALGASHSSCSMFGNRHLLILIAYKCDVNSLALHQAIKVFFGQYFERAVRYLRTVGGFGYTFDDLPYSGQFPLSGTPIIGVTIVPPCILPCSFNSLLV